MIDIKIIREKTDLVRQAVKNKNSKVDIDKLLSLDERRRHLQGELDQANSFRNVIAKASEGGKPSPDQIAQGKRYKEQASTLEDELGIMNNELRELLYQVPNIPTDDTPIGTSEVDNKIIREWGEKPAFEFTPKP